MEIVPFVLLFPQQGEAETRTITFADHAVLPGGQYALVDSYCTDPACDCQRVMINVVSWQQTRRGYLASIGYGFDRDADMAGPYLDPLNPQSEYAEALLEIVSTMLEHDAGYVRRLQAHYRQVKEALADPSHPTHQALAELDKKAQRLPPRRSSPKRIGGRR